MITASVVTDMTIRLRELYRKSVIREMSIASFVHKHQEHAKTRANIMLSLQEARYARLVLEGVARMSMSECLMQIQEIGKSLDLIYGQRTINQYVQPFQFLAGLETIKQLDLPTEVGSHIERYDEFSQLLACNKQSLKRQETASFLSLLRAEMFAHLPPEINIYHLERIGQGIVRDLELIEHYLVAVDGHFNVALKLAKDDSAPE